MSVEPAVRKTARRITSGTQPMSKPILVTGVAAGQVNR
jgi:hypothetical protein